MSQATITGEALSEKEFEVELVVDGQFDGSRTITVTAPDGKPRNQVDLDEYDYYEVGIEPGPWADDPFGHVAVIASSEDEAEELAEEQGRARNTQAYDLSVVSDTIEIAGVSVK